ncbi:hypothetical protein L1I30_01750 [Gillisia sp. M10.2A]|uniref:Uncharacterized protein n=1 Tax=Gillisia lutea TaxID=2909668 RepID=A0ABS9EC78_9FLAO|nr:hypothetical protein [Gillisia lutea]MCF4100378.1 hypothetical protein [Gillisia lutea]
MKKSRLTIIISVIIFLLLIPLIAMQFTNEVQWSLFDFIVAAILLFSTGLTIHFMMNKIKTTKYRILLSIFILCILLLLWAELAVGIFGSPISGS